MNDQQQHWDELHSQGAMKDYAKMQTEFAEEAIKYFPQQAKVLELGCGLGNDAVFFSQRGYTVVATDFSETAIEQNKRHYDTQQNLSFQVVDMSKPLPFTESEFDVVYARLHSTTSLIEKQKHYLMKFLEYSNKEVYFLSSVNL